MSEDDFLLRDSDDLLRAIRSLALEMACCDSSRAPTIAMQNCLYIADRAEKGIERLHQRVHGQPYDAGSEPVDPTVRDRAERVVNQATGRYSRP